VTDTDCVFCRIIEGTLPAHMVFADDDVVAFLDLAPAADGHTLVVPRAHCRNLLDAPAEVAAAVMAGTQRVARLLMDRLGADGISVVQSNEAAAWQEVLHLHVHVIPRFTGDSLVQPWSGVPTDTARLADVHARLTAG
jgi:histidine triad (HIT) family protein